MNKQKSYNQQQKITKMATFFIQTDKQFYFAGDTVNGNVFVNVGAMIVGAQGLSLKFSGYQCVKWVESTQLHRPAKPIHRKGHPPPPPPFDPIAAIPPHLLVNSDNLNISDCQSQGNMNYDHRPKFIRTSSNRYFKMKYFETRNMFTKKKMMIHNCSGFPQGQFSFPFSFKTFEGWPASFNYHTPQKKGVIIYHMTAAIEPITAQFQIQGSRQIILRQTRLVQTQNRESSAQITSCCCIPKGRTMSRMSFEKDGYMPGQMVQMIIEIDNTDCTANVSNISITVNRTVSLRSQGSGTSDHATLFRKTINGVAAGQAFSGNNAIREAFQMPMTPQMKPTCSGKLLSAQYSLNINLNHDITCECCSKKVGSGVPIIIFPLIPVYNMPSVFQNQWAPKLMPQTILVLPNDFANFNMNAMNNQQMPPLPPPMINPQMNNTMNNSNLGMQGGMGNQGMGMQGGMGMQNNMGMQGGMGNQGMGMQGGMGMQNNMEMQGGMGNQGMGMQGGMGNQGGMGMQQSIY